MGEWNIMLNLWKGFELYIFPLNHKRFNENKLGQSVHQVVMVTKINDSFISPYSHFSVATLICDLQSAGNEKNLQKEILECKKHFNFRLKKE